MCCVQVHINHWRLPFPHPPRPKARRGGYILGVLSKGQAVWEFWFLIAYLKKFQTCMAYYFDMDLLLLEVWGSFRWLKMLWVHTSPWKLTCFWKWRRKRIPKKLRKEESGSWRHLSFGIRRNRFQSPQLCPLNLKAISLRSHLFATNLNKKKNAIRFNYNFTQREFLSVLSIYLPPYEDKVKNTRSVF